MIILNVPYRPQKLETGCFPTSIKMVLNYFGDDVDERILWKKGKIRGHAGTWDAKLAPYIINKGYYFDSYWDGLIEKAKLPAKVKSAYKRAMKIARRTGWRYRGRGTIALVKKSLTQGIPILAEVDAASFYKKKTYEFTHIIVLTGFDKTHFYYLDPWRPSKKTRKILIKQFQKCWKLSIGYRNSMTLIYPKKSVLNR